MAGPDLNCVDAAPFKKFYPTKKVESSEKIVAPSTSCTTSTNIGETTTETRVKSVPELKLPVVAQEPVSQSPSTEVKETETSQNTVAKNEQTTSSRLNLDKPAKASARQPASRKTETPKQPAKIGFMFRNTTQAEPVKEPSPEPVVPEVPESDARPSPEDALNYGYRAITINSIREKIYTPEFILSLKDLCYDVPADYEDYAIKLKNGGCKITGDGAEDAEKRARSQSMKAKFANQPLKASIAAKIFGADYKEVYVVCLRSLSSAFNKVTADSVPVIATDIIASITKALQDLKEADQASRFYELIETFVRETCEKACAEAKFSRVYATLICHLIRSDALKNLNPAKLSEFGVHCQHDVAGTLHRLYLSNAQKMFNNDVDLPGYLCVKEGMNQIDIDDIETRIHERRMGTALFIGYLYEFNLLQSKHIINTCIPSLLYKFHFDNLGIEPPLQCSGLLDVPNTISVPGTPNPSIPSTPVASTIIERIHELYLDPSEVEIFWPYIEACINLFGVIGPKLDAPPGQSLRRNITNDSKHYVNGWFDNLKRMSNEPKNPSRIRFLIQDLLDRRASNWSFTNANAMNAPALSKKQNDERDSHNARYHSRTSSRSVSNSSSRSGSVSPNPESSDGWATTRSKNKGAKAPAIMLNAKGFRAPTAKPVVSEKVDPQALVDILVEIASCEDESNLPIATVESKVLSLNSALKDKLFLEAFFNTIFNDASSFTLDFQLRRIIAIITAARKDSRFTSNPFTDAFKNSIDSAKVTADLITVASSVISSFCITEEDQKPLIDIGVLCDIEEKRRSPIFVAVFKNLVKLYDDYDLQHALQSSRSFSWQYLATEPLIPILEKNGLDQIIDIYIKMTIEQAFGEVRDFSTENVQLVVDTICDTLKTSFDNIPFDVFYTTAYRSLCNDYSKSRAHNFVREILDAFSSHFNTVDGLSLIESAWYECGAHSTYMHYLFTHLRDEKIIDNNVMKAWYNCKRPMFGPAKMQWEAVKTEMNDLIIVYNLSEE